MGSFRVSRTLWRVLEALAELQMNSWATRAEDFGTALALETTSSLLTFYLFSCLHLLLFLVSSSVASHVFICLITSFPRLALVSNASAGTTTPRVALRRAPLRGPHRPLGRRLSNFFR